MTTPDAERGGRLRRAAGLLMGRLMGVAGALVVGQIVVGLIYVVGARAVTPATLGLIATCVAIATIAATVFDGGLIALLVRETAGGTVSAARARVVVRTKRRWVAVLLVAVLAPSLVIAPSASSGILLGLLGVAMWEAQTHNGLLRAQERFTVAATSQVGGRVLGLGVALVLAGLDLSDLALPAALLVGYAAEAVAARVFLGGRTGRPVPQRDVFPLYREALSYGLASLAASAQQVDTPLVALGAGPAGAGLYAAASRLLGPLGFLPTALSLVGAPWLARARHDEERLRHEERLILRVALALAVAPLGAALLGPPLLPLLLGPEYSTSGSVLAVLAVGSVLSTLNQPLAIVLQTRGRQATVALAIAVGLGIGLVATFVLALLGGALLAAVGFVLSQMAILVHLGLAVRSARARPADADDEDSPVPGS